MECKQEQQEGSFGEEAAMAAGSTTLWSLLHRLANGFAGYLGLARGCDDDSLKAPAAKEEEVTVMEEDVIVQVQSRSAAFHKSRVVRGVGEGGGKKN